jgi:hypothetical protein
VDVGASLFVAGASPVQHAPAPEVVTPPASPLEPASFIYQEQQRLEEAKYTFSPEERARVDQFNAERAQENARLEGELAGLDAQIAQERAAHPGQETRRLRDLLHQRGEVAARIKPPLDLARVTAEVEAVMNDSSLSDKQKQQALEDLRNKYGLKKHGGPVSMHDTFTGRLARLTKDSMHRLDEARKTAERALDAQIREAERKYGRRSPEVAALKAQKAQLSAMYKEERSLLSAQESFLHRAFRKKKRGLFARIKNAFKKLGRGIANVAKSAFKAVTSLGKGLLKGAGALFRGDLKGAFRAVTTGIKDTVHHAFQALRSAVPLVTSLIPGMAVLMAIPKVGGFITKVQQGLVDAAASITQGVIKTWTHLGEGVLNGASALAKGDFKGAFKAVGQSTKEALKSGWKTFNEALPYLVTAACFVPGLNVVAIPLRLAMAARDLATAIKNKDALGIAGAVVDGVAGGAAGRGLKLVARAADVAGQGLSVAHGVQAAARGDALGAVTGFAGGAAGRGRLGEVAGNVSLGASAVQAVMVGDSAGVFQAAGGIAGSRRGRTQDEGPRFDTLSSSSTPRTSTRGMESPTASRGLDTVSRGPTPHTSAMQSSPPGDTTHVLPAPRVHTATVVAPSAPPAWLHGARALEDAPPPAKPRRREDRDDGELRRIHEHIRTHGLPVVGGAGPMESSQPAPRSLGDAASPDSAPSSSATTSRGLPEAATSSAAPKRKRTRADLPQADGAGPSGTHGDTFTPATKKSRPTPSWNGTGYVLGGTAAQTVQYGPRAGLKSDEEQQRLRRPEQLGQDEQRLNTHYGVAGHKSEVLERQNQYARNHKVYVDAARKSGRELTAQEAIAERTGKNAPGASINHIIASATGQNTLNHETLRFVKGAERVRDNPQAEGEPGPAAQKAREQQVVLGLAEQAAAVGRVQGLSRAIINERGKELKAEEVLSNNPRLLRRELEELNAALRARGQDPLNLQAPLNPAEVKEKLSIAGVPALLDPVKLMRNVTLRQTGVAFDGPPQERLPAYKALLKNTYDSPGNLRVGDAKANNTIRTGFDAPLGSDGRPTARSERLREALKAHSREEGDLFTVDKNGNAISSSKGQAGTASPTGGDAMVE